MKEKNDMGLYPQFLKSTLLPFLIATSLLLSYIYLPGYLMTGDQYKSFKLNITVSQSVGESHSGYVYTNHRRNYRHT